MDNLVKIRKQMGLTSKHIAGELGISVTTLSRYEGGMRDISYRKYVEYALLLGYDVRLILR